MRQLAAWQRGDKFYLSAFVGERVHVNGATPAKEFPSKAALEAHARTLTDSRRRPAQILWEHEEWELEAKPEDHNGPE